MCLRPPASFYGASNVDLHVHEFSHLGWHHWHRANTGTAWTASYNINTSTGYGMFYRGYGASSDASLKGDVVIVNTADCLNLLRNARPKVYRRLDLPDGEGERVGFIAQDVEAACPPAWRNLVGTSTLKWANMPDGGEIKTLDYARLVCPLWEACRSMLARIEQLEAQIAQMP